ncbi:amino acid permease-domain-containing protein [Aspergillus novoparasiticus]|uniref:Amino acid permease-domain-containing protein n=1 Tax=Aspergillus novoparasiticus TaxID=986946 RepID=A0A5N6EK25_9EURO|nr:amino acid permease-domain-containing protein [Aspergillus novoparasiticus]
MKAALCPGMYIEVPPSAYFQQSFGPGEALGNILKHGIADRRHLSIQNMLSMELDSDVKRDPMAKLEPLCAEPTRQEGQLVSEIDERQLPADRFSLWSTVGVQFSVTGSPLAIGSYLQLVMGAGGSPYFFWCLVVAIMGQFLICVSLAELSSVYPHAAGTAYWVSVMAPPKRAHFLSYCNGMSVCLAFTMATCGTLVYCGTFIMELVGFLWSNYSPELWHVYICVLGAVTLSTLLNTIWIRMVPSITGFLIIFINSATVFLFITLLVKTNPKASASTVFLDIQNSTGWSSDGIVFLIALLPGGMVISMFDTATHMAEELPRPDKQVWQVMVLTNLMNAIVTIVMCLGLLFCLTHPENLLNPIGDMPILQLCWDAWPNRGFLITVILCYTIMNIFASVSLQYATSRVIWSFSKTGAFPFSSILSKVNTSLEVPVNSVIATGVIVTAICVLVFGPQTVQNGLFGTAGLFFVFAYLSPIMLLLKRGRKYIPQSRSFNLGRAGPLINILACCWGLTLAVFLCFPMYLPVTLETMNWTSVCAAGFSALVLGNWFWVRSRYHLLHGLYIDRPDGF